MHVAPYKAIFDPPSSIKIKYNLNDNTNNSIINRNTRVIFMSGSSSTNTRGRENYLP